MFYSPKGLHQFQEEGVELCYSRPDNLVVWDTGLGKSVLAMAVSSRLLEDDKIDICLVVAKKNKTERDEWPKDFHDFTDLPTEVYLGPKRAKILDNLPQVLITTYETARNDVVEYREVPGRKTKQGFPTKLSAALEGKRVLVVYDEFVKVANRKSALFKSQDFLVQHLRKGRGCRVMALTATPLTRDPENFYNLGRILSPDSMGTVDYFNRNYIKGYDFYGNPNKFKNLDPETTAPGIIPLSERLAPIMIRKRKTDADVRDQFPDLTEEFKFVDLHPRQRDFYDLVEELFRPKIGEPDQPGLNTVLRQIAGHPQALLDGDSQLAGQIVQAVGRDGIESIPSAKTEKLIEYLYPITVGQGAQVLVFTFFGPSMIPHLQRALKAADITTSVYYGGVADREAQKEAFRRGETMVLLSSDAGSDGVNIPEASYVVEYDLASTFALRTQRINRASRLSQGADILTAMTFIARDTAEEHTLDKVLMRNEWAEQLYEQDEYDDAFVTAQQRRELVEAARKA